MRNILSVLILCSLSGCASLSDPAMWAAMAGGAAAGAGNTGAEIRASQQQNDAMLQRAQVSTPQAIHCTSTNFTPGVVQTNCN